MLLLSTYDNETLPYIKNIYKNFIQHQSLYIFD